MCTCLCVSLNQLDIVDQNYMTEENSELLLLPIVSVHRHLYIVEHCFVCFVFVFPQSISISVSFDLCPFQTTS